jgi:hypothetical protein
MSSVLPPSGRSNCVSPITTREVPVKVRTVEIWSVIKLDKGMIMSRASQRDIRTAFFQKCE